MSTPETVPTPPRTVVAAFWLHVVGAILGLAGAVLLLVTLPASIDQAVALAQQSTAGQDTAGVDVAGVARGAAIGGAVLSVVMTIAFSVLTIVFARKLLRGRNWARIVLTVFAGLQLLGVLDGFGLGALHFLVLLAAVIAAFAPVSNAWFRSLRAAPAPF